MDNLSEKVNRSLMACAIPGVLVAFFATIGAALGWGELSFNAPTYYLILAIAAWCPASKLLVLHFWRRDPAVCFVCVPASGVVRALSRSTPMNRMPPHPVCASEERSHGR